MLQDLRKRIAIERNRPRQQLVGDDRFRALSVAGRQVFLIFKRGGSLEPMALPPLGPAGEAAA